MLKRPEPPRDRSTTESSSQITDHKRAKIEHVDPQAVGVLSVTFTTTSAHVHRHGQRVHLFQKDGPMAFDLAEFEKLKWEIRLAGGEPVKDPAQADLIVTNITKWPRLKLSIGNVSIAGKRVVKPAWLRNSIELGALQPMGGPLEMELPVEVTQESPTPSTLAVAGPSSPPKSSVKLPGRIPPASLGDTSDWTNGQPPYTPAMMATQYSCLRFAPMICPNEDLVQELKQIWLDRYYGEGERKDGLDTSHSLAYARGMAAIRAYPHRFTEADIPNLERIGMVGKGIAAKIAQFVRTGRIELAQQARASQRLAMLQEFAKVAGVGAATARDLYDRQGIRTLQEVAEHYHSDVKRGFKYLSDFDQRMQRSEVEEIADHVNGHLQAIAPGTMYEICGGYRRGKTQCGDCDILFTHDDDNQVTYLLRKLLERLDADGSIEAKLILVEPESKRPVGTARLPGHRGNHGFDRLEKAFIIYKQRANPAVGRMKDTYRRVDLVSTYKRYYWCAIVGWTGGIMFGRDLRRWADKQHGWTFDSCGIYHKQTGEEVEATSEEDVFEKLGLRYIPPQYRCTDA